MYKLILLAIVLTLSLGVQAQSEAYEKSVSMSLGNLPALVLDMNDIDSKTAEKYWSDYVREYSKLKRNKKADEYYAEDARIPAIAPTELDLFCKIEDLKGSSRLYVWIDKGGAFIDSNNDPKMLKNAKIFINDFAVSSEKMHVEELLEMQEKTLKGLEKDLKGLEKDLEGYEKDIENAKEKIAEAKKDIEENVAANEAKTTEIEDQKNMVLRIKERLASIGKNKTKM